LHNWLLEVDGLDKKWQDGVPSYWEASADQDTDDKTTTSGTGAGTVCPDAVLRLQHPVQHRNYDFSAMGIGNDVLPIDIADEAADNWSENEENDIGGVRNGNGEAPQKVRYMKLADFRQKLVMHFNIAFHKNELQWPRQLTRYKPSNC
jgi:hypothetical protein